MKKASFALIIGLFLLSCACASAQNGLIKGKVTDTATPRPNNLSNATVIVQSELLLGTQTRTDITDAAGNYEISNLSPGEYVVTTSKPGYDDSLEYVTVTSGDKAFHDVRLYKTDTLITYFWKMGPLRWLLLLCFLLLLLSIPVAVIYIIRRSNKLVELRSETGEVFISRVREALQNSDVPGAISICDGIGGLANILKAGLLRYVELSRKGEATGEDKQQILWRVQNAMEEAGVEVRREYRFRWPLFGMFAIIGGIALLCGFLGTVMGVVRASTAIDPTGTGDPDLLTRGIMEAMLTTWFGSAIAIISGGLCLAAFIAHMSFKRRKDDLISETQQTFAGMVNSLSSVQTSEETE